VRHSSPHQSSSGDQGRMRFDHLRSRSLAHDDHASEEDGSTRWRTTTQSSNRRVIRGKAVSKKPQSRSLAASPSEPGSEVDRDMEPPKPWLVSVGGELPLARNLRALTNSSFPLRGCYTYA
jgi:hypothetical protein